MGEEWTVRTKAWCGVGGGRTACQVTDRTLGCLGHNEEGCYVSRVPAGHSKNFDFKSYRKSLEVFRQGSDMIDFYFALDAV